MSYSLHPPGPTVANTLSPLSPSACRLLNLSLLQIARSLPLFSIACSLFSENTGGGGTSPAQFVTPKAAALRRFRPALHILRLSPLSTAFTPIRPLTPLSTAFTHFDRGVGGKWDSHSWLSASTFNFQLSTVDLIRQAG